MLSHMPIPSGASHCDSRISIAPANPTPTGALKGQPNFYSARRPYPSGAFSHCRQPYLYSARHPIPIRRSAYFYSARKPYPNGVMMTAVFISRPPTLPHPAHLLSCLASLIYESQKHMPVICYQTTFWSTYQFIRGFPSYHLYWSTGLSGFLNQRITYQIDFLVSFGLLISWPWLLWSVNLRNICQLFVTRPPSGQPINSYEVSLHITSSGLLWIKELLTRLTFHNSCIFIAPTLYAYPIWPTC